MKRLGILALVTLVVGLLGWTLVANASTIFEPQGLIWKVPENLSLGSASGHGSALDRSFRFQVAYRRGDITGSLTYEDNLYNLDLESLTIDWLNIPIPPGNKASFGGTARLRTDFGQPPQTVPFSVEVVDNGEPGIADTFRIQWWAAAGSYSFYSNVMRGNIQVQGGL